MHWMPRPCWPRSSASFPERDERMRNPGRGDLVASSPSTASCCATVTGETDDGLSGKEGTFLICSFWLVSALSIVGERGGPGPAGTAAADRISVRAVRRGVRSRSLAPPGELPAGVLAPRTHRGRRLGSSSPTASRRCRCEGFVAAWAGSAHRNHGQTSLGRPPSQLKSVPDTNPSKNQSWPTNRRHHHRIGSRQRHPRTSARALGKACADPRTRGLAAT